MLATLVIVFREVFEAGLVIGIVAAALGKAPHAMSYIWGGVATGTLASAIVAIFAGAISNLFGGFGQELMNAVILCLAVSMLAWHSLWMTSRGSAMAKELKALGQQAASGAKPMIAIATVIMISVLREGAEVVLFLFGAAASSGATGLQSLAGGVCGIALGGIVSYVTYKGIIRIPMRWIFSATTAMIALLASGMAAQAAHFFQSAGAVQIMSDEMWDLSSTLPEKSLLGIFLKALVGYSDRPTSLMLLAFVGTLIFFGVANILGKPRQKVAKGI